MRSLALSVVSLAIVSLSASAATQWQQTFEGATDGWLIEGGVWEIGAPTAVGGPAAFAGANVAGTTLAGNYPATSDARLLTPEFVVPAAAEVPRLTFHYWYQFGANDSGRLQIRPSGGAWQDISGERLTETAGLGSWARRSVDLRAFAGQSVQLSFQVVTAFNNSAGDHAFGWYVDDVALETGAMILSSPADFENGFGDWSVEGGVWQRGTPSGAGAPAAFTGTAVVGTILSGNYGRAHDARLVTPEFVVPAADQAPRFIYHYWYQIGGNDLGQLQIRTVGGAWEDLAGERLTETAGNGSWARRSVDLRAFAGQNVQLAFHFVAAFTNVNGDIARGWYIDAAGLETGVMTVSSPAGFENDFGDWSVEGGVWQRGAASGAGAPPAFAGANVVGTILSGNYGRAHDARLVTPEFVVPAADQAPRFSYHYWYQIGGNDSGRLEIRVVGGAWENIPGEELVEAPVGGWARRSVDLRAYAGQNVQLAFHLVTVFENRAGDVALGWYIDEARLETGAMTFAAAEGFENGFGDWSAEGGVWQVGTPSAAGEPTPFAGANVAGTVVGGTYGGTHDARLVTPEFVVPAAVLTPRFVYHHWYAIGGLDHVQLQIRVVGAAWQDVPGERLDQVGGAWTRRSVDLRSYAGQTVQLAFRLVTVFENRSGDINLGWYLDEARVHTGPMAFAGVEEFEAGFGDWSVEGGVWQVGAPTAVAGPSANAGASVAGTILAGNYLNNADARLVTPEFLVPPAARAPQLSFRHWRALQANDRGRLAISVAGEAWTPVGDFITGSDTTWKTAALDLTPYAGQQVRVGWHFTSDAGFVQLGWYVDDVHLGTVDPALLTLGAATSGTLASAGARALYVLEIPPGGHLRFTLDDLDNLGANEIYVRRGAVPTAGAYDYRFTGNGADQAVFAPNAGAGTWFILIVAAQTPAGGSAYQVRVDFSEGIALASVTPARVGNAFPATLSLAGAGFDATAQVDLRAGATIVATGAPDLVTAEKLRADFDLTAAAPGTYELTVTQGAQVAAIPLEVTAGGVREFDAKLIAPGRVGRHAPATLFVEYANLGQTTIAAPLLIVHGSDRALLTLDAALGARGLYANTFPAGFSDTVQILAQGEVGGLLLPGERRRVPIYCSGLLRPWNFNDTGVAFELRAFAPPESTPLDWSAAEPIVGPAQFSPAEWDALFAAFRAGVGGTWGEYVAMLARNAAHLQDLGLAVNDIGDLIALEFAQADGLGPVEILSASTDLVVPQPGVQLTFARAFHQAVSRRQRTGPLGFGWSHNWAFSLAVAAGGDVTVTQPDGARLAFQPDLRGGYFGDAGNRSVLRQLAAGRYELTAADGLVLAFRADGLLESMRDRNGSRVDAAYSNGQLASLTHTAGGSLQLSYNAGLLQTVTDSTGGVVTFTYDSTGHLASATHDGAITLYTYNAQHALTAVARPGEPEERMEYDARGRLISLKSNCCDQETTFSYPHAGLVLQTDPSGATTRFFYDQHGLLARVQDPLGRELRVKRDAQLQLTSVIAPGGAATSFGFDKLGNLARIINPRGGVLRFTHAANSSLASVRDARNQRTSFTYDSTGDHASVVHPDNSSETFTNDTLGLLVSARNRRGQTTVFIRDAAGRVTRKETAEGRIFDYTYDARSNLTRVDDSVLGATVFEYDERNRLSELTHPDGRGFTFSYDDAGRRTASLTHDGYLLLYDYDPLGRLREIVDGEDRVVVTYSYDAVGRLVREDHGNGTATTYGHDAAGQVTSIEHLAPGGATLSRFEYTYDVAGRQTSAAAADGTTTYAYDALGQLVSVIRPGGAVTSYTYDADGNRTLRNENGVLTSSTTNVLDAVLTAGAATFTYDADGNLASRTAAGATTTYAWDSENRLVSLVSPTDGTWEFTYDAFGRRISTTHDGQTTTALHDPAGLADLVAEYDGAGGLIARYDHGHGLARRVAAADTVAHYHFDVSGNTRELTDGTGAVVNHYDYHPFGTVLDAQETVPNPFQYVGRFGVRTTADDLLEMRARNYSPSLGRFLSVDPLRLVDPLANAYRYAGNDPVSFIDPSGLARVCIRALDGKSRLNYEGMGIPGKLWQYFGGTIADWLNVQSLHQQFFFDNGKSLGYFTTGDMFSNSSGVYGQEPLSKFEYCGTREFNDERLRRAIRKVGQWKAYWLIFKNCQSWVEEVIETYEELEEADAKTAATIDPNELVPPAGYGAGNHLRGDRTYGYRVNFENDRTATAPTQVVEITNALPAQLDLAMLEFTSVGFGDVVIPIPAGSQRFEQTESVTFEDTTFDLLIELSLDLDTREVRATFSSILPDTGLPPPVEIGFLPPEDDTGRGMGHVGYTIRPVAGLSTDTEIRNIGFVTFDRLAGGPTYRTDLSDIHDPNSAPSLARQALVTIDADAPTSSVTALPASTATDVFTVSWSGTDAGAGIASFDIYTRTGAGPWTLWLDDTSDASAQFTGEYGRTFSFFAVATDGVGFSEAAPSAGTAAQATTTLVPGPRITEQPSSSAVTAGQAATLSVSAEGDGAITYQWRHDGVNIAGATAASYTLPSSQVFHGGSYTVVVTASGVSSTSQVATLAVGTPPSSAARLLNLSTRGLSQSGDNVLIPGFVIQGTASKRILIRAVGPTLAAPPIAYPGTVIPDPRMTLKRFNFVTNQSEDLADNDDWGLNSNAGEIAAMAGQLFAFELKDPKDAALLLDLPPGQYTVVAGDVNDTPGIAIVELYDADASNVDARLINISNRGFAGVGDEVMIPGFVVSHEGPKTFLIRAVGPRLAAAPYNVPGTMTDPKLTVYQTNPVTGQSTELLSNDNWSDDPAMATTTTAIGDQVLAFPLDAGSQDAAFVVTLEPGVYTVVGSSADGIGSGVVLVELYLAP